jgi:hypothetical protein
MHASGNQIALSSFILTLKVFTAFPFTSKCMLSAGLCSICCNPSAWEANAGGFEFKARLGYIVKPYLKLTTTEKKKATTTKKEKIGEIPKRRLEGGSRKRASYK